MDVRTVLILTTIYNLALGCVMVLYGQRITRDRGISIVGHGSGAMGICFLLLSLRDFIPPFASVIVANGLLVTGMILVNRGLKSFLGQKNRRWLLDFAVLVPLVLLFWLYTFAQPNVNTRVFIISIYVILLCGEAAYMLITRTKSEIRWIGYITASVFVFGVLWNLLRAFWTLTEAPLISFMAAGWVHAVAIVVFQLIPFALALGMFWMSNTQISIALETQALQDALTGLYNRGALNRLGGTEFERSRRHHYNIGVAMCDIDHFKRVNDTYGHHVGDHVLEDIAKALESHVRVSDLVARYGGEEFAIVVLDVTPERFEEVLEKLRQQVEALVVEAHNLCLSVTVSIGGYWHSYSEGAGTIEEALRLADAALYEAKRTGRNRVVIK